MPKNDGGSNDLLTRLEAATGPDREIDRLIRAQIPPKPARTPDDWPALEDTPHYTDVFEQALRLVPDGMDLDLSRIDGKWSFCLGLTGTLDADIDVSAPTAPLAICIACVDLPSREEIREALEAAEKAAWQPIETAPKGGGAERVDDPAYTKPPTIRMLFGQEGQATVYWDWYYSAEMGDGYVDGLCDPSWAGWVIEHAGEIAGLHFSTAPTHWQPLPEPTDDN